MTSNINIGDISFFVKLFSFFKLVGFVDEVFEIFSQRNYIYI